MKVITEHGIANKFVLYYKVYEDDLKRISEDKNFIYDVEFIKKIFSTNGDNAYISVINSGEDKCWIRKGLRYNLKFYKSISWWDRDHNKFYILRRK